MKISEMGLAPHVRANAEQLQREFGDVIRFTSGYRDLMPQARAMASNVMLNRRWIEQTYRRIGRPSYFIGQQLQAYVLTHPELDNVGDLTLALFDQLVTIPQGRLISYHCWRINGAPASLAFDFDLTGLEADGKLTALGQQVWAVLEKFPYLDPPPMRREGGLVRGHVQFQPLKQSTEV